MDKQEIVFFVCMNESGDFEVGTDESDTANALAENQGGVCVRTVRFIVNMSPPNIEEVEVDVPDEAGKTTTVEAA